MLSIATHPHRIWPGRAPAMDLKSMIGWFGTLLAAACAMVGIIAAFFAVTSPPTDGPGPDNLLVPISMLFLKPIGLASMATGAVGLFWPPDLDRKGHTLRCWIALIVGAITAAISFVFGPTF